jgi:signal transduction histidine kinase
MAASGMLLLVSLVVGAVAAWVLVGISRDKIIIGDYDILVALHAFDLLVETLIAVAVVLMGKAIVSYEIFTGKTLPRSGLLRYWGNSLVLAAGYGALVSWSLDLPVDPIYRLMLATVLMTLFYALLSWRSYAERDRSMQRLRPFISSQHLYEQMVAPLAPTQVDATAPFRALCEDVLDARSAVLLPLGPLAPLVEPLFYDERSLNPMVVVPVPSLEADLVARLSEPGVLCLPIMPERYHGAIWSVPLWSERGLIGVLLLGAKRGDALYTQEEIEIARAAAERLIDTRASAELARRLMDIQRRRLAESHVLDRRTRRVLHDDVLPQIHTAMILLQSIATVPPPLPTPIPHQAEPADAINSEVVAILADAHRQIADLLHDLPATSGSDLARLGVVAALRVMVAREQSESFDHITWDIDPATEQMAHQISALTAEVLFYATREAMRNAARHGRGGDPQRSLQLHIGALCREGELALIIEDDGVGFGAAGASPGSGRGLMLHSTMLAVVGGSLIAEHRAHGGTCIRLAVPMA